MSALPDLHVTEFAAFFRAIHGRDPFPWQCRLAATVASNGWPPLLDLPTGSGKTAALDIAVFALALDAGRNPRTAPLRIAFVVDRRTVVDQAYDRARTLQAALAAPHDDVTARVSARLRQYSGDGVPLLTAAMRGGIARDDDWARTPDQPLIAVSTVDQVGSRLLFRGYGLSDSMRPIHAGLLGSDVLFLLDEVHLSQPFCQTLAAVRRYRMWAERPLDLPFAVVEMSATVGESRTDAFRLEDEDRQDAVLAPRLTAAKPAQLVGVPPRSFIDEVQRHLAAMLKRPGATIAVVVNRVNTARNIHQHVRAALAGQAVDIVLLTGRMRPVDRDAVERRIGRRISTGRSRRDGDRPIVVVATQSIEAGADFDFDDLITECASLDALRQRFGRLDRLGLLGGRARGVVIARNDCLKADAVYGDAIGHTWAWLREQRSGELVDFGISALRVPADARSRGLLAPAALAPTLLPSHLDAWVQTDPRPDIDPEVALWLHGPQRGLADVQIVWRADLSSDLLARAISSESKEESARASEVAISIVEALPPVSTEAMSVPFLAAKRWLQGLSEPESADVEGVGTAEDENDAAPAGKSVAAVLWQGERSRVIGPFDISPGQTLVVPASIGGIDEGNWSPGATQPVLDVADAAAWGHGRRPALRLHPAVIRDSFAPSAPALEVSSEMGSTEDRDLVLEWLEMNAPLASSESVTRIVESMLAHPRSLRVERLATGHSAPGVTEYLLVSGRRRTRTNAGTALSDVISTEDTRSSFTGARVTLSQHLHGVAATATGFADRTGMASDISGDLRIAAQWHDAGKADHRFQQWLHGGSQFKALVQTEPLAKSGARPVSWADLRRARQRAGYPAGARHELVSVALMRAAADMLAPTAADWELVQHLVAVHHGYCRPFAPVVIDDPPVNVAFEHDGLTCATSSAHCLERLDSGVAECFWVVVRRYGWWGAAWFEALLRLADHRQSAREGETRDAEQIHHA